MDTVRTYVPIVLVLAILPADSMHAQDRFRRGDPSQDGVVHLSDATFLLFRWFLGATDRSTCDDAADVNDDGRLNLSDPVYILNYLFLAGHAPPPPSGNACGLDVSPDDLGCLAYETCSEPGEADVNFLGMNFVRIPAGTFLMGSPETERGRNPNERLHTVTISCDFDLQSTEVTQGRFLEVMGQNPSRWQGPDAGDNLDRPVDSVTWPQAREFCRRISALERDRTGRLVRYRLPTEAEWEYACRAGTRTRFWFGDLLQCSDDRTTTSRLCDEADRYMWYWGNVSHQGARTWTQPVASKPANPFGLFDMHRNVREWCRDWYGVYPSDPVTDPTGAPAGTDKVIRGSGLWALALGRSAWRGTYNPHESGITLGFRVVREIDGCHLAVSD